MYLKSEKYLPNSNISSTCSHNMVNFGPLAAKNDWRVWATPANFNGFRVLASLLQRRRLTEVNQTLQDVWPSPGLVHYICIFWFRVLLPSDRILPHTNFTLRPILAFSYIGSVTARHCSSGCQPNFAAWYEEWITDLRRRRHLCSALQPLRWASPTFLVLFSSPTLGGRKVDVYHTSTHDVAL